jgi:predicted CoA-binding protein
MKRTLVLGASPNANRYSHLAALRLMEAGHEVFLVGNKDGEVGGVKILKGMPFIEDIDTLTLYVGPANQAIFELYIFNLRPKRIIFNPGTENPPFMKSLADKGIEVVTACTLVMLSVGTY